MPNETTTGAPALPQQNAPVQNDSSMVSVSPSAANVNPVNSGGPGRSRGKKFARGKETHVLQAEAKVNTLAIKCYEEQLPFGEAYLINAIRTADPKEEYVIAIRQSRDLVTEGIWATATVKPHWHFIAKLVDSKGRRRVTDWMKKFGIKFRPGIDDQLWEDHGVESIGTFAGYALYLTHETADAIRDGKEKYEMDELVSNLTIEQIEDIRAGYIRVTANKKKLTPEELAALDQEAYDLGCKMGNFDAWYGSQPFIVRSSAKIKTIRESYHRGVEARIAENPQVNRLCVFIKGDPDSGKTYGAIDALAGKRVLSVKGGGTGKFDNLRPDHDAIVIDDTVCPNLLNMSDNYICHAYRRQSNNPAWAGDYFIVTSNLTFDGWLEKCGITSDENKDAARSRFFICDIHSSFDGTRCLNLIEPSRRGTKEVQQARLEMFRKFRAGFDASIGKYSGSDRHVDYSDDLNSVRLRNLPYEAEAYDHARWDAIIEFACWFWSSVNGGFACYYDDHPAEWKDAESEIRFLQNDAELKKAIRKCRQYFSGSDSPVRTSSGNAYCKAGDLVRTLSVDELLEPVRLAWWDYFGVVPPLAADRGYDSWKARVIEKARGEGHKYCRGCRRIFPLESRFCSLCGNPLLDDTVYGDIEFVSARIHLADERGCDVADVPDEDVTALVYKADGHDCGIMFY